MSLKNQHGKVTVGDLPPVMVKLKAFSDMLTEDQVKRILSDLHSDLITEVNFEEFLRVSSNSAFLHSQISTFSPAMHACFPTIVKHVMKIDVVLSTSEIVSRGRQT